MDLYEALRKLEEEEYYARANAPKHIGGKGSSGGSQFGTDTHTADQQRIAQNLAGKIKQQGTRMGGHTGEEINIKPSDVDPNIKPGSKNDTWAMTSRGTEMRQTLHDPNPQRFMPPSYFAHLQNMQNMAAFPGQVRGGGMPRRQERHAEKWAAIDARREALGQMNAQARIQSDLKWLQKYNPGLIPEYMERLKEQGHDQLMMG